MAKNYYSENKKLAQKANARIKNLRKETGIEEPFAVKQLLDKLSAETIKGTTKSGLVSVKKNKTELQQKAVNKALTEFLSPDTKSTVKQARQYRQRISNEMQKNATYTMANITFQARKDYKWIYEYMEASDYWPMVDEAKEKGWDVDKFSDEISKYIVNATIDEEFKKDLENLYYYSLYGD